MATYSQATAAHETLTASTVDTVTLTQNGRSVTVVNRTGTSEIYFTAAVSPTTAATPTVGGANCWVLPASVSSLRLQLGTGSYNVALISSGTMAYSVEGV